MRNSLHRQGMLLAQVAANTVVGYLFLRVLAAQFGVTAEKDGFDIAYSVPFIVLNLSGFAFIHAVVATQFAKTRATSPDKLQIVFSTTLTSMLAICAFLLAACGMFSQQVITILGPGLSPDVARQAQTLMLWMLPLVLTLGLSAYFSAVLTAFDVPVTAELCQIISRLGVGVCLFLVAGNLSLEHVALGLVCGSVGGLAITWFIMLRVTQLRFRLQWSVKEPEFQTMLWQGGSFFLAALAAQLSMAYMRRLATLDEVGTNAALTYCLGLVTPVSVLIGKPIALATGPNYSRLFAQGKWESVSEALRSCFLQSLGVSVAIACLISYFPCQILSVFYGGGAFDSSAVTSMAALCSGLAWSLPAATVLWVILLPLLNLRSRILPAVIYIVGYALQIVVTAFLFSSRGRHSLVLGYLCGINFQAVLATAVIGRELLLAKKRSLHEACC